MKPDATLLLDEVLNEGLHAGFADSLLADTLRHAGRRRRGLAFKRCLALAAGGAAAVALLAAGVFLSIRGRVALLSSMPSCAVVHTAPLAAASIVETRALVQVVPGGLASVEMVHTTAVSGGYRRLQDSELLAILLHHPAALVRQDPQAARLIFLNPADSAGFPAD